MSFFYYVNLLNIMDYVGRLAYVRCSQHLISVTLARLLHHMHIVKLQHWKQDIMTLRYDIETSPTTILPEQPE